MTAQIALPATATSLRTAPSAAPSPAFPLVAKTSDNGRAPATLKESPMVDISPAPPMRFAPIPLVSGMAYRGEDGETTPVSGVEVVITCEDGTTHRVSLEQRNGGWWVPRDQLGG